MLTRPTSNIKKTKSSDRPAFVLIEYRILLRLNCIITRQRLIPHNKTLHDFSTITIFFFLFLFFFFAKTCGVKKNKKNLLNQRKQYRPVRRKWHGAPLSLCFSWLSGHDSKPSQRGAVCWCCCSSSPHGNPHHTTPTPSSSSSSSSSLFSPSSSSLLLLLLLLLLPLSRFPFSPPPTHGSPRPRG